MNNLFQFATYGGPVEEYQGFSGKIVKRTSEGIWITLTNTFLQDEVVDTNFAYGICESILHNFFGWPVIKPWVTILADPLDCLEFND